MSLEEELRLAAMLQSRFVAVKDEDEDEDEFEDDDDDDDDDDDAKADAKADAMMKKMLKQGQDLLDRQKRK
jgi:hypothetical protein